jgi:hypothetical protein
MQCTDATSLQYDDGVVVNDCVEPMRDSEARPTVEVVPHKLLDVPIGCDQH